MKRRSVLASMGAFTASGSTIIGSGAFSSVEANRSVTVKIVEDESAYVGLEYDEEVSAGPQDTDPSSGLDRRDEEVATITNKFTVPVEVEIDGDDEVGVEYEPTDGSEQPVELGPGDHQDFDAVFECEVSVEDDTRSAEFTVTAIGTGDEVSGELDRPVKVTCEGVDVGVSGSEISFVAFCGIDNTEDIDITNIESNDDSEPVSIDWEYTGHNEVKSVIVKSGTSFWRQDGGNSGTASSGSGELLDLHPSASSAPCDTTNFVKFEDIESEDNDEKAD
ncbi:hypothetical protein [Natronomonas gomsonensis]|uniref:hypothetical protein n=1 Tax=Natronomonas gomsonensis TaxID=1046043 RepID=UPI0015BC5808|nr:hypothetical protein [Natronomonas gomsonensis]